MIYYIRGIIYKIQLNFIKRHFDCIVLQIQSFKGYSNFIINLAKNHFLCCFYYLNYWEK